MREAGKDTRGEAFVKGMSTQLAAGIAERKAITATANKYMEDLGGIENMNLIEPSQKGAVTDFLRTKRDEFNDLATQHAENPSSELRDKMDAIKFQFQTVNNQLKIYMDKRKEYLSDRDEGNLQTGGSFDGDNTFFESTYGNPDAAFSIDYKTGKISFTGAGNETRSLEDFGDHTLRNYEGEASASTVFADAKKIKYDGGMFDKSRISQQFVFKHRGQGADEIQSLIQTDLSGDNSDLGFMQQWASGNLKDKSLYEGFEANKDGTYDASWMLENGNKQQVLDSMGKFVGNVSEDIYNSSDENPDRVRKRNQENKSNGGKGGGFKKTFKNGDGEYIQPNERQIIRESVFDEGDFDGYYGDYKFNETNESYDMYKDGELVQKDISKLDVLTKEGGRKPGDPGRFRTAKINKEDRKGLTTGQISVNSAFVTGDDDASAGKINQYFKLDNSDYKFVPYYSQDPLDRIIAFADQGIAKDAMFSNDIMLIGPDGKVATDTNGKPIRISTSSKDPNGERDKINAAMVQYGLLDDFEQQEGEQEDPLN